MIKELKDDAVDHKDDNLFMLEALANLVLSRGEEVEVRHVSGIHCSRAGQGMD